jgi:hypothetical protein
MRRTVQATVTRRTVVLAALAAAVSGGAVDLFRRRGRDVERLRAYEALIQALLDNGALPGAASPGDGLQALYATALPARRREIDAVLDGLVDARLTRISRHERVAHLRRWAAAGGERRALAAHALALAAAAYGPIDDRAVPVVI